MVITERLYGSLISMNTFIQKYFISFFIPELSKSKDVELMTAVLDAYLEPSLWNLPTSKHEILEDSQADVHSVRLNNLSLAEIKSNVVQVGA